MLAIFNRFSDVNVEGLLEIYSQSLKEESWEEVSLFWDDLQLFFRNKDVFLACWIVDEKPVASMRVEPYLDGYLISCLETNPQYYRNGYAFQMVSAVMDRFHGLYYSHVDKRNKASLGLHKKLGFQILSDYAVHVDGSVYSNSVTLRK